MVIIAAAEGVSALHCWYENLWAERARNQDDAVRKALQPIHDLR